MITYISGLRWPNGVAMNWQPRPSRFSDHSLADCMEAVRNELSRMVDVTSAEISADWSIGARGYPLTDRRVGGPVALRYQRGESAFTIAICEYQTHEENLWAIAKTLEALRTIERHAGDSVARQAETGFAALPPSGRPWWDVLGVSRDAEPSVVQAAYKALAKLRHPDLGGSDSAMAELNAAMDQFNAGGVQ